MQFDIGRSEWSSGDICALATLLQEFSSKTKFDLGHRTAVPFIIELKPEIRHIKQKPYCCSPVTNQKVQVEIDMLSAEGISRKSNSNWVSPAVIVLKSDGSIWLTCNYKQLNDAKIVPVLPLPTIYDL